MQINCTVLIDRDSGNKRKSVISIYHKVLTSNVLRPKWNGNKVVYRKSSQAQICWYFFFQWFKEEFASLNIFTHNLPQKFLQKNMTKQFRRADENAGMIFQCNFYQIWPNYSLSMKRNDKRWIALFLQIQERHVATFALLFAWAIWANQMKAPAAINLGPP